MDGNEKDPAASEEGVGRGLTGRLLNGRYKVGALLASGGVALVYAGKDQELDRPVAIKVLREERGNDSEFQRRLHLEARALAKLAHPNIVNLLDHGLIRGMCYLVMELVQGRTLADLLQNSTLDAERAVGVTRQILQTLQFAHEQGILHRDLKPGNIFLQELPHTTDHVKILDFGFAKFLMSPEQPNQQGLTRVGIAVGTPAYMAPEQAAAGHMDRRTDLYAAGVITFEMLVGRRPFEGQAATLMRDKVQFSPPKLRESAPQGGFSKELEDWMDRALARNPEERFPDAETMLQALENLPKSLSSRPMALVAPLVVEAKRFFSGEQARVTTVGIVALLAIVTLWLSTGPMENGEQGAGDRGDAAVETLPPAARSLEDGLGLEDPWEGVVVAPPLAAARTLVNSGAPVAEDLLREVAAHARANVEDPFPRLLLGHIFTLKERRPLALAHYEEALALDPDVRGDMRMVANIVAFAARPGVGRRAARVIRDNYGAGALAVVEAALRSPHLDRMERQRLRRLADQLSQ